MDQQLCRSKESEVLRLVFNLCAYGRDACKCSWRLASVFSFCIHKSRDVILDIHI